MLDTAFLEWLRATTEARWADPSMRDAALSGLGELAWQPGTRWRGGLSASDLGLVESVFTVRFPGALRRFLAALHTPDPPMAALAVRGGRLVSAEGRLFTDWTGPTTPILAAQEAPLDGVLRGVAIGRWHPAWGERPPAVAARLERVRRLAGAAPRLIPLAGARYVAAPSGADDGPVIAVHGADAAVVALDLRGALLRELGLADPDGGEPVPADALAAAAAAIPFWGDVAGGIPWRPEEDAART